MFSFVDVGRHASTHHVTKTLLLLTCTCTSLSWRVVTSVHYCDVIMGTNSSQIASLTIVYSNLYSGADQRKHQSSASLAFVRGIYRRPVNSPHRWAVTRKMFPFDDIVIMICDWGLVMMMCKSTGPLLVQIMTTVRSKTKYPNPC